MCWVEWMVYYFIWLVLAIMLKWLVFYLGKKWGTARFIWSAQIMMMARHSEGVFVLKPWRRNSSSSSSASKTCWTHFPPLLLLLFSPWDIIIIFYHCVYIKSSECWCQFGNEIVCARDLFRLEINGSAIKTLELHYLVTIMIMSLAGGVNFTSGVGCVCV